MRFAWYLGAGVAVWFFMCVAELATILSRAV